MIKQTDTHPMFKVCRGGAADTGLAGPVKQPQGPVILNNGF
jgi:hypothetical protein